MKTRTISFLTAALIFASLFTHGQAIQKNEEVPRPAPPRTLVAIMVKPGRHIPFNLFDVYHRTISFTNRAKRDSLIKRELFIDKPLQLIHRSVLMMPEKPVLRTYSILVNPGDTVILKDGQDGALSVSYSSGYPDFVDSLISESQFLADIEQQQKQLTSTGIEAIIQNIEAWFKKNETAIANLDLPSARAEVLGNLNSITKNTAMARLLRSQPGENSRITDSLYNDLYQHITTSFSIDAVNNPAIYETLIIYSAKKQNPGIDKNDLWSCILGADERIKQTAFFKNYSTSCVVSNFFYDPKTIVDIKKRFEAVHPRDPFLDTLYHLADILSHTFSDFRKAKQDLQAFAGGRFYYIFENSEHSANNEMKTLNGLPPISMLNLAGNKSDFKQVVHNKNYKLTVVDLWASWCVPCIIEMPHLKKIETRFKGKPVQFVGISIDKEEDAAKWVQAAKNNGIYDEQHQYRLINFKESPLTKLLDIQSIPRYLVINNKGEILDDNFSRPSNSNFEFELLKYLD